MDSFITKDGKRLRRGYTTGSCAAAAAKAAAIMLLDGRELDSVYLLTPGGIGLTLPLCGVFAGSDSVCCGVVKDSGDDPDVTNGITIYARVEKISAAREILIDGGVGIGRVTKPGLDQPVGHAAINSTPRRMIERELRCVMEDCGYLGGLAVTVFAPDGAALAEKTFNPRLGIEGGISILGTTGIVEPMSDGAVVGTIRAELNMRAALGRKYILLTPGNYGADYIKNTLAVDPQTAVMTSNFIGDAFLIAAQLDFDGALLVGHIGKLVKLACGMFNTHSRYGDGRAEIFAAHAALCGAGRETVEKIMDSVMTDDMLDICDRAGIREAVMASIIKRMASHLGARPLGRLKTGILVFSNRYGGLGATPPAFELLKKVKEEG